MGSSGQHRQKHRPKHLRTILFAAGIGVVAAVALTLIFANSGSSSADPAVAPQAASTSATPRAVPDRADRDEDRAPIVTLKTVTPEKPRVLASGSCEASTYGEGQSTASGERFDPSALTAAHKTLPLGSKVRVTNKNNGRSVVVRINDRGPFVAGRCLDLSTAAMQAVDGMGSGVIPVKYEVLSRG